MLPRLRIPFLVFIASMLFASLASAGIYETTYYSDYFETVVGWSLWDNCDGTVYSDQFGTLDGAYMHMERRICYYPPTGDEKCFQKVDGAWVRIDCPPWFAAYRTRWQAPKPLLTNLEQDWRSPSCESELRTLKF